ncbi:MAG: tRNA (adenosine(37)-N6)-threonylcarbamoyltransferase complex ATPase subunit type 1 TsaE [Candidatus Omnitrophica bacterium]|nr:tRNA (adenosine(37)-N6)-threonylcarbamoyltransferase complex ATPase subunit type 1 TsaE [Candidatus Omnitrophota bacterium]
MNPKSKIPRPAGGDRRGGQNPQAGERQIELVSGSIEETQALGEQLGRSLRPGDVVALCGELGSGKTTLVQGIARGLGRDPETIKSPTFVLMREYPPGPPAAIAGAGGDVPVIHIDGYRLEGPPAVSWLDIDLIFSPHKITLIEWAQRFTGLLPDDVVTVQLTHVSTNRRRLILHSTGPRSQAIVAALRPSTVHADSSH